MPQRKYNQVQELAKQLPFLISVSDKDRWQNQFKCVTFYIYLIK